MDYSKIKLTLEDGVAIVAFNDPSTMNAASMAAAEELTDVFAKASSGALGARAVVLTGEGRGFCSGADLSAQGPQGEGADGPGDWLQKTYNPLMTTIRDLPIPLVTAVNGAAAGIGCSFALMGDLIIAAEGAFFLQAFRRIGLVPDGGSTYLLPRMIGRARAMEMVLLGDRVPAKTALEWGMINRCVPDAELMPTALKFAKELAAGPKSLGMIRRLMWDALDTHWAEQLKDEALTQAAAALTEDFAEGVDAFMNKRAASFKGK